MLRHILNLSHRTVSVQVIGIRFTLCAYPTNSNPFITLKLFLRNNNNYYYILM